MSDKTSEALGGLSLLLIVLALLAFLCLGGCVPPAEGNQAYGGPSLEEQGYENYTDPDTGCVYKVAPNGGVAIRQSCP